jgi:hypothetical protein
VNVLFGVKGFGIYGAFGRRSIDEYAAVVLGCGV